MTPAETAGVLRAAADRFAELVATLPADAWERPTVCEVTVGELVEHVVAGNEFAVRLLSGASAEDAWLGIGDVRLGDDPVGRIAESGAAQATAFADADPEQPLHHPSGDVDHLTFVRLRLAELVIHGWDVAVAAGLDATMEPATAAVLWRLVNDAGAVGADLGPPGAYADPPADPLPGDAPLQHRLLAAFGRPPRR